MFDTAGGTTALFPGLYAGTVTDVRENGRLMVGVPAVYDVDGPEADALARPCLPYGHFFVPPVGAKVWIAFENGDPAAPVWIGTWFPQGGLPPEADSPDKRVVRTASGHLIVLDDRDGEERITVADTSGNRIELSADGVLIKCAKGLVIDASGQSVRITAAKVEIKKG
ncbi:phage baseplate assembly protein V [Streptomyces fulvoviolaceus]|uniref:phage baseplate assembly protein V n=1 Tax=Streptomyces fulvoviolaceus TaxID=285535 RepID=UPI000AECBFB0|nr:phage baseplate assembly protein V [Streptomyces fulvoviolaceus]MCT9078067.1 phage baseplate assembly protein V [Streptomyces fulvoviolaceus]